MVRCVLSLLIVLAAFLAVCDANAQTTTATGFESMMNSIIRGAPGVTNVALTDGVSATASGTVSVLAGSTGAVSVPTSVVAKVGYSSIAKGAARVGLRAVPWVGTALILKDIAGAVSSSGYATCPPPAFFCKPSTTSAPTGGLALVDYQYSGGGGTTPWINDPATACSTYVSMRGQVPQTNGDLVPYVYVGVSGTAPLMVCNYNSPEYTGASGQKWPYTSFAPVMAYRYRCASNNAVVTSANGCPIVANDTTSYTPATEDDINAQLAAKINADHNWAVAMKAKMDAVTAANPGLEPVIDVNATPVTVTAPQTTGPSTTVSTRTIPNADGSTSTETVKQQVVVTPSVSSSGTVSNPGVTFPAQTVTTTTTTNNTTNVTTTTTNTTNLVAAPPVSPATAMPTDYNREVTQKAILQQLDGSTLETPMPVDQEARTKTQTATTDKSLDDKFKALPGEIADDKSKWFSWVWTPPVASCSPSMFQGTVRGMPVNWDICPWVEKIRDAIGFLFAIFGAMNIYSNLFRKESV